MSNLKTTGITWLPFIKKEWGICRVKDLFYTSKEKAKAENPTILSLARSGIKVRDISNNEGQLASSYYDYNPVKIGDLLLNPMDLYSGANCNVSEIEGVISPAYANLRSNKAINPKFFDYYFKSQYWTMAMFAHGKGVSFDNRWTINNETLMAYEIPNPSLEIQNAVVEQLNDKVFKIDSLLRNQELLLGKLKELKGKKLKELFDDLLIREKRKKLLFIADEICSGTTPNSSDESLYEGDINWIQSGDIKDEGIFETQKLINKRALDMSKSLKVLTSPFVTIAMYGGSIGHAGISYIDACTNQACCNLKFKNEIMTNFYYLFLVSRKEEYLSLGTGGTQPNINQDKIKRTFAPYLTTEKMKEYLNKINLELDKIQILIDVKIKKIEKLKEYKKSLIYEYVTGKKFAYEE